MTPFGERMRDLRKAKGVTLKDMADAIGVSSAYLSALEHGKRGRPGNIGTIHLANQRTETRGPKLKLPVNDRRHLAAANPMQKDAGV